MSNQYKIQNEKVIIFLIFASAVIIRFLYVHFFYGFTTLPGMDEIFYDKVATNISNGLGFVVKEGVPTAKKPPLYLLFLGIIYFIFGKSNFLAVRLFEIIIGGFCSVLIYFIAKRLSNQKVAIISSILVTIDPILIYISGWILAHIVVYLFICLAILFCLKTIENPTYINIILAGIFWGLVALTMGYNTFIFYPYLFFWGLVIFRRNRKLALKISTILVLTAVLIISIWTIRNYIGFGKFIPLTTSGGYRFRGSNNPRADGIWTPSSGSPRFYSSNKDQGWGESSDWESWAKEADALWLDLLFSEKKDYNEYEVNMLNYRAGFNWIKNNPIDWFKLLPKKFFAFWEPLNPHSIFPWLGNNARFLSVIFYCVIFPFFMFGIYLSIPSWKNYLIIYLAILHSIIGALIYYGDAQQRVIITPFLSIFAAVTLSKIEVKKLRG